MQVGIVGAGVVGGTMAQILRESPVFDVRVYDPHKGYDDAGALNESDLVFVSVWTPMVGDKLDESALWEAVDTVDQEVATDMIVVRSTVLPGTMTELIGRYPDQQFAFVPEFLTEEDPYGTSRSPDRIVVGMEDDYFNAVPQLVEVMEHIAPGAPMVWTNPEAAVLVKLASNAMLAAKVALANEMALICDAYGETWDEVRSMIGLDRRIGPAHMRVTERLGYGGSCFPKDMRGLIYAARAEGVEPMILEEIERANDGRYV